MVEPVFIHRFNCSLNFANVAIIVVEVWERETMLEFSPIRNRLRIILSATLDVVFEFTINYHNHFPSFDFAPIRERPRLFVGILGHAGTLLSSARLSVNYNLKLATLCIGDRRSAHEKSASLAGD
jgi:hypothetical protein